MSKKRSVMAALFATLALQNVLQAAGATNTLQFESVAEAFLQPWGSLFWIERSHGEYRIGDTASRFKGNLSFDDLTFDISNNKVLANVGVQGSVKNLTIYRDSYRVSGNNYGLPGVWMAKDNSSFGPYAYKMRIGETTHDLASVNWDFKTGLLDNIFPITQLRDPEGAFVVHLLTFAPVSADGAERLRGLVYGLHLQNVSDRELAGEIELPEAFADSRQDFTKHLIHLWEPFEFEFALGDRKAFQRTIPFSLDPDESIWVPTILYMPGGPTPEKVNKKGTLGWFQESWSYYRSVLGRLKIPENEYLADFFERQVLSALQSIALSADGDLAGTNWGSYPTTRQIWMKDAYYSCLPMTILDPSLAPAVLEWFAEFGVRHEGTILAGGVNHSLSLSVASIVLAGLYYEYTGDTDFFARHPHLRKGWEKLLEEMIASRSDETTWLFPSRYISDGAIEGDYHTGTNVVAWRALKAFSRLLDEVYLDASLASRYAEVADKVRDTLLSKNVIEGPFGRQFIESVDSDGKAPRMASDGEESDTTLMPFYRFVAYDNPLYLHYMRFSMSSHNEAYQPKVRAITWAGSPSTALEDRVPATAPGYVKGLALGNDFLSLFGDHGYYSEVRRITDVDGSMWWWPYGWASNPPKWNYEHPVRMYIPGKSGWFSGVHTAVFLSRYLGVSYDAPTRTLRFAPSPLLGNSYEWQDFPMGKGRFSLTYERTCSVVRVTASGLSGQPFQLDVLLPVEGLGEEAQLTVDGSRREMTARIRYLERDSVRVRAQVAPGQTTQIVVVDK